MKSQLLSYLLEASICFEILYLFYWLILQQTTFFVLNRVYLLAMATIAWLIPLLVFDTALVSLPESQMLAELPRTISLIENTVIISQKPIVFSDVFLWIYLVGLGVSMVCFVWRSGKLYWLVYTSHTHWTLSHQRIDTQGNLPTFSFLNYLFWDNTAVLTESEKEQIFQHELVHIRERHSWDILYAELLKVVFWINPAVYLFKKELHLLHEYRADTLTAHLYGKETYIGTLLDTFFKKLQISFSHSFNQHGIQMRTTMLHKKVSSRLRLWWLVTVLPLLAMLLALFSFQNSPVSLPSMDSWKATTSVDLNSVKPRIECTLLQKNARVEVIGDRISIHSEDFPYAVQLTAVAYGTQEIYKVTEVAVYLVDRSRAVAGLSTLGSKVNLSSMMPLAKARMRLVIEVKKVVAIDSQGEERAVGIDGSPLLSYDIIQ